MTVFEARTVVKFSFLKIFIIIMSPLLVIMEISIKWLNISLLFRHACSFKNYSYFRSKSKSGLVSIKKKKVEEVSSKLE